MTETRDSCAPTRSAAVAALRERMLEWYAANKRDLPWRSVADAYALVTVELMSQQTGVERIAARWQRFVERFPSWEAVASAPLGDVIREWQGLGYNRRAVSLHRMATAVVERYGGALPADRDELLKLPGVGPYTANAILSFVHGHDVAAIDVNLRRVIGRVAFGDAAAADADVLAVAQEALPPGRSGDWNQALMDFASLVCTLRRPVCLLCPLRDVCRYANEAGEQPAQVVAYPLREDTPGRRAAERRAPFVGSTRYYRGRIVEALRGLPAGQTASLEEIVEQSGAPEGSVDPATLVAALVRDGLVHEHEVGGHQRFSLP